MKKFSFINFLKPVFTLDLRAMALMRIGLSLVLIADLIIRFSDIEAYYTESGILPQRVLYTYLWTPYYFSVFNIGNSWQIISLLFIVYFLCLLCLLTGYKTRLFTIICWIFILSVHNRNPLIDQGGDDLMRMGLFWAIFMPWGYYYSIDSLRSHKTINSTQYSSVVSFAFICQIGFLYFFSALLKSSPEWRSEFTAIYYALSLDQIVTPFGKIMYPYGDFLRFLTAFVYYVEFLFPILLFIPFLNSYLRMAFIIIIGFMQIGIYLTLNVGLFSITSVVILIGIIPPVFMDKWVELKFIKRLNHKLGLGIERVITPVERQEITPQKNRVAEVFVFIILIYTFGWNIQTTGKKVLPDNTLWIAQLFRVDQYWAMFGPAVFKDDGWYILQGKTLDGREIDLFRNGKEVSYDKPENVAALFKNDRWRKYHEKILLVDLNHFRPYYCFYLLNYWNRKHPDNNFITDLEIIYMKETTLPDYQKVTPKREMLCNCRTDLRPEVVKNNVE